MLKIDVGPSTCSWNMLHRLYTAAFQLIEPILYTNNHMLMLFSCSCPQLKDISMIGIQD